MTGQIRSVILITKFNYSYYYYSTTYGAFCSYITRHEALDSMTPLDSCAEELWHVTRKRHAHDWNLSIHLIS
uniref:Uncharacterized protein n=1 Tax=Arundo donax TaxID=35708 RepID=A0A0A9DW34_ARUDO